MVSSHSKMSGADVVVVEDLIMYEILPRLPIKSLMRLKLVCKKWHNLITQDSLFITTNHSLTRTNVVSSSSVFFCGLQRVMSSSSHEDQDYQFKMLEPTFINRYGSTKGSTNGLIYGYCCQHAKIFICNPITKHVVAYIPNPKCLFTIALACDSNPNFRFSVIAINRPSSMDDDDPNFRCQFEVYSSKTGEWRVSKNSAELLQLPSRRLLRAWAPLYVGGKVYWSLVTHILWFDVEEDVAGLVPCPDKDNLVYLHPFINGLYTEIGVSNGELSYSKMTKEGDTEIWLLRNTSSCRRRGDHHEFEWVKRHTVRLQEIVERNWEITAELCHNLKKIRNRKAAKAFVCRHSIPLPYLGGEVVWFCRLIQEGCFGKFFSINLSTQEAKVITDDVDAVIPFTPTLLPCPT